MLFNIEKPITTRDGRKVTLLHTEVPGKYPLLGLIQGRDRAHMWTSGGLYCTGATSSSDLINAPDEPKRKIDSATRIHNAFVSVASGMEEIHSLLSSALDPRDGRMDRLRNDIEAVKGATLRMAKEVEG